MGQALENVPVWDNFSDLGLFLEILFNEQRAKLWIQQSQLPPGLLGNTFQTESWAEGGYELTNPFETFSGYVFGDR